MVASKTDLFDKQLQQRACLFKALAHPVRIQIIQNLALTGHCLSGDLSEMFPLSRTTLNQHMKELRKASLIESREMDGKTVYCLHLASIGEMHNILSAFMQEITLPDGFCCECDKDPGHKIAS